MNFKFESAYMNILSPFLVGLIAVMLSGSVIANDNIFQSDNQSIKKYSAQAAMPVFQMPGDEKSVTFDFDKSNEMKGELNEKGKFKAEGWVAHKRLRCATYQLGVRFGKGELACVNVEWLTDVEFITEMKQCNQSKMHHVGHGENPVIKEIYNEISCAELQIKCTGVCN